MMLVDQVMSGQKPPTAGHRAQDLWLMPTGAYTSSPPAQRLGVTPVKLPQSPNPVFPATGNRDANLVVDLEKSSETCAVKYNYVQQSQAYRSTTATGSLISFEINPENTIPDFESVLISSRPNTLSPKLLKHHALSPIQTQKVPVLPVLHEDHPVPSNSAPVLELLPQITPSAYQNLRSKAPAGESGSNDVNSNSNKLKMTSFNPQSRKTYLTDGLVWSNPSVDVGVSLSAKEIFVPGLIASSSSRMNLRSESSASTNNIQTVTDIGSISLEKTQSRHPFSLKHQTNQPDTKFTILENPKNDRAEILNRNKITITGRPLYNHLPNNKLPDRLGNWASLSCSSLSRFKDSASFTHHGRTHIAQPVVITRNEFGQNLSVPAGSPAALLRSNPRHLVRRTMSDEPRTPAPSAQHPADVESEYVTLDANYFPPKLRNFSKVTEAVPVSESYPYPNDPSSFFGGITEFKRTPTRLHDLNLASASFRQSQTTPDRHSPTTYLPSNSSNLTSNTSATMPRKTYSSDNLQSVLITHNASLLPTSPIFNKIKPALDSDSNSGARRTRDLSSQSFVNSSLGIHREADQPTSGHLTRSKSMTDLNNNSKSTKNNNTKNQLNEAGCYSDDDDGDHFGFLSHSVSLLPSSPSTAMSKVKTSSSPGGRIFSKRLRNKTTGSSLVPLWMPGPPGSCCWSSVSGRKVQLRPANILTLTEAERVTLQQIALTRLQELDLGCEISLPKVETTEPARVKKSPLSLKKRSKSVSSSALDTMDKEGAAAGLVFGIPLVRCVLNDRELQKRRRPREFLTTPGAPCPSQGPTESRGDSSDSLAIFQSGRKSSSSSQSSVENMSSQRLNVPGYQRSPSTNSLSGSESSHHTSSSLIDALSLSTSSAVSRSDSLPLDKLTHHGEAQVPYIVQACFKHIESFGLQTLGIFRVGSSKRRVKQLREEFDCGKDVKLNEEHNPHDIGALLKEYFRDLPEPLLTRQLYMPFLCAERINNENKRHAAIGLLVSMLPAANRDTLWALLRFLAVVSQHSSDYVDHKGEMLPGNKMDSHNLATLFGPNILRQMKATSDKDLVLESTEKVGQSKEVIEVVRDMIDNHQELFEISQNLRDDVLKRLAESSQETVDKILRHLANQNQIETDPESVNSVFEDSSSLPALHYSGSSDADLISLAQRKGTTAQPQLRTSKSADDCLELTHRLSLMYETDPTQTGINLSPECLGIVQPFPDQISPHRADSTNFYLNSSPNRTPVFKLSNNSQNQEARDTLQIPSAEYPRTDGFTQGHYIPARGNARDNSSSGVSSIPSSSSDMPSARYSTLGNYSEPGPGYSSRLIPPARPISQAPLPKELFFSVVSSPVQTCPSTSDSNMEPSEKNLAIKYSAEWEQERWKYWETLAAQKNGESEQETLV